MTSEQTALEIHACESCGRHDAVQIGDCWLCVNCYAESGSCCPEFGKEVKPSSKAECGAQRTDCQ